MKKNAELSIVDPSLLESLRQLSGIGNIQGIKIKKIEIDYRDDSDNYGGFSIVDIHKNKDTGKSEKVYQPIGKTFSGIILKRRNIAKCFDANAEAVTYYTREFDSWTEPLDVFSAGGELAETSFYKPLKLKFNLKSSMILYVYYENDIYRLQLSASSMFTFGDYEQLFHDSHMSLVKTEFSTKEERKSKTSPKYFICQFRQESLVDPDISMKLVKELNQALNIYQKKRDEMKMEPVVGPVYEGEKIDIEDLPF